MKRRKGFTLVELLSAIACLSIVLVGISSVLLYVLRGVNTATEDSRRLTQIQTMRKQMEDLEQPYQQAFTVSQTGEVIYASRVLGSLEGLREVTVEPENGMLYCTLTFQDGETYCFIIGKEDVA